MTVTDSLGCTSTDIYVSIEVCGCTDPTAVNYIKESVTLDDGSCIPYIYGYH